MTAPSKRDQFLAKLRENLIATYPWASVPNKLAIFMVSVEVTIDTDQNKVMLNSPCIKAAWEHIGNKGVPSYKALRAQLRGN